MYRSVLTPMSFSRARAAKRSSMVSSILILHGNRILMRRLCSRTDGTQYLAFSLLPHSLSGPPNNRPGRQPAFR